MCRNEEWLEASIPYTENVFLTALSLRMVPPLLRPVVQWLLPSSYRLNGNLRLGKRLKGSLVDERRKLEAIVGTTSFGSWGQSLLRTPPGRYLELNPYSHSDWIMIRKIGKRNQ